MKALLFAPAFAPYMGSESLTASKLVIALKHSGWDVDVISRGDADLYSNEWEAPWDELKTCTYSLSTVNSGRIGLLKERVLASLHFNHLLPGIRWAALAEELGRKMLSSNSYDVILSRSPPDIGHLPAMMLAKEFRLPWIANWNDPAVGSWPAPYNAENGSQFTQLLYSRYFRDVYSHASLNTFPSIELASHIQQHFGVGEIDDVMIIPHCSFPTNNATQTPSNDFVITHAGKLMGARNTCTLLDGFRKFVDAVNPSMNQIKLQIIGHADSEIKNLADSYGLGRYLNITGPMPFLLTMKKLCSSTVNLLLEASCEKGIFLPGKLVDYAQAGRPILAISPDVGVARRLLDVHGGGIHANVKSSEDIFKALITLYSDWQNNQLEKHYPIFKLSSSFSPSTIVSAYEEAYRRVIFDTVNSK
jgi:glycosyltransferase involved in cell wall biosynthesis